MRKAAVMVCTVVVLALAGTAAASVLAPPPPPFPTLPGSWTHITINRKIRGQWHTLILDRGRIVQVSSNRMTLLESDGTTVPVDLDASTIVEPARLGLTVFDLRRGMAADTMRIDGGAAVRVRVRVIGARRLRAAQ